MTWPSGHPLTPDLVEELRPKPHLLDMSFLTTEEYAWLTMLALASDQSIDEVCRQAVRDAATERKERADG